MLHDLSLKLYYWIWWLFFFFVQLLCHLHHLIYFNFWMDYRLFYLHTPILYTPHTFHVQIVDTFVWIATIRSFIPNKFLIKLLNVHNTFYSMSFRWRHTAVYESCSVATYFEFNGHIHTNSIIYVIVFSNMAIK